MIINTSNASVKMRSGVVPGCLIPWQPQQQPSTWVKLLELPNPYSDDEALLLCQHSDQEWVVWIPNHGEAILHSSQFYHFR